MTCCASVWELRLRHWFGCLFIGAAPTSSSEGYQITGDRCRRTTRNRPRLEPISAVPIFAPELTRKLKAAVPHAEPSSTSLVLGLNVIPTELPIRDSPAACDHPTV